MKTITVCDQCLRACCWKGIFMCEGARDAGTTERTPDQLKSLAREHSDYWDGTYEQAQESDEEGPDGYEPGRSVWSEE